MNKEEIRQALVKFDREDLLFGNNDIYLDDNVEVFLTISQMIKFNNQQKKIDQLTNNWSELEECVESRLMSIPDDMFDDKVEEAKRTTKIAVYQVILGKMKGIKGGSNDKTRTN